MIYITNSYIQSWLEGLSFYKTNLNNMNTKIQRHIIY